MPLPELHPLFCIHLDYFLFSQCSSSWSHSWRLHPALHTAASMAFINVFHFSSCFLTDDSGKRHTLSIAVKSNTILNTHLKIAERLCGSDAGKQNQCLLLHVHMPHNRLQVRRQQERFVSIVTFFKVHHVNKNCRAQWYLASKPLVGPLRPSRCHCPLEY